MSIGAKLSMDIIIELQVFLGSLLNQHGRAIIDESLNGPKLIKLLQDYKDWTDTQKDEMGQA